MKLNDLTKEDQKKMVRRINKELGEAMGLTYIDIPPMGQCYSSTPNFFLHADEYLELLKWADYPLGCRVELERKSLGSTYLNDGLTIKELLDKDSQGRYKLVYRIWETFKEIQETGYGEPESTN